MSDYQVGDTIYHKFTTRAFASGVPTVLSGTPVVSIYEDDSVTQITAGITLSVDFDSVVGLNHLTVVATGANGFETGKFYQAVITTGTVGGVSVVGETVWTFSLEASAAALDLANGTDGLGSIKSDTAATLVDTAAMQPLVAKIPLSDGTITWNSTALASVNAECDTAISDASLATSAALATVDTNVDAILVDTAAMQPLVAKIPLSDGVITWNSTALASINAECDTAITDAALATAAALATVDTNVDSILVDTADMQPKLGTPAADISADIAAVKVDTAATLVDTNELQGDWADGGRLDLILDARAAEATVAALNDITSANVNTEVADVLFTDTHAELAAIPAANAPLADKINYIFMNIRNKMTQTATTATLYADDTTTEVGTSTVSDDATTATKGEWS